MIWPPECDCCGSALKEPGGLLFGPPDEVICGACVKDHLCKTCWEIVVNDIRRARSAAPESENTRLRSQLSALREALNNARSFHGEQCRIFQHKPLGCDCGATDHNARIDAALASTEPGGEEP